MILKYIVPKQYRKKVYDNKRVIYCEILQKIELKDCEQEVYKIRMLNYNNFSNIFSKDELQKLNILDRIKVRRYKNGY